MGICDECGALMSGEVAIRAMAVQHDRGNGLGGGFAGYGIYPEFPDHFCFHMMYHDLQAKEEAEAVFDQLLHRRPRRADADAPGQGHHRRAAAVALLPAARPAQARDSRDDRRGLRRPRRHAHQLAASTARSSPRRGKNMGAFKGVGFPEEIGHYYLLEEYEGHTWIGHNRFPTNTPGWWGGAHPFTLLDWSIVHNGEISSYGINSRYLEQFGYKCTLGTDTEVAAYLFDLMLRRHKLPLALACKALASPAVDRDRPHARGGAALSCARCARSTGRRCSTARSPSCSASTAAWSR